MMTKTQPPSGGFFIFQRIEFLEFARQRSLAGRALSDANPGRALIEHGNVIDRYHLEAHDGGEVGTIRHVELLGRQRRWTAT